MSVIHVLENSEVMRRHCYQSLRAMICKGKIIVCICMCVTFPISLSLKAIYLNFKELALRNSP